MTDRHASQGAVGPDGRMAGRTGGVSGVKSAGDPPKGGKMDPQECGSATGGGGEQVANEKEWLAPFTDRLAE